jgi:hypothetical protein
MMRLSRLLAVVVLGAGRGRSDTQECSTPSLELQQQPIWAPQPHSSSTPHPRARSTTVPAEHTPLHARPNAVKAVWIGPVAALGAVGFAASALGGIDAALDALHGGRHNRGGTSDGQASASSRPTNTSSMLAAALQKDRAAVHHASSQFTESASGLFREAAAAYAEVVAFVGPHGGDPGRAAHLRLAAILFKFGQCRDAAVTLEGWVGGSGRDDVDAVVALATVLLDCPNWSDQDGGATAAGRWRRAAHLLKHSGTGESHANDSRALVLLGRIYARPPRGAPELQDDIEAVEHLRAAAMLSPELARGARGRAYWQELGTALGRLGRPDEVRAAHREAVDLGVWPSLWQRPGVTVRAPNDGPPLRATPWWDLADLPPPLSAAVTTLSSHLALMVDEGVHLLRAHGVDGTVFLDESEGITLSGRWLELVLFERGLRSIRGCTAAPEVCRAVQPLLVGGHIARLPGSQIKLSAVSCDAAVVPHTGPTNGRLRLHVPLHVPDADHLWQIRAGDPSLSQSTRRWIPGTPLLLDDSFEHELWGSGSGSGSDRCCAEPLEKCYRLILIVDLWHPDLTLVELSRLGHIIAPLEV